MKSKNINPFAEIDRLVGLTAEPAGPEWFTVAEYAEHAGYSHKGASDLLNRLHKQNKLERWFGRSVKTRNHKKVFKYRIIHDR